MHAVKQKMILAITGILVALVSNVCFGAGIPDKVTINSIQKYYEPVSFNHAAHINKLKDCGLCHHHTTGAQVTDPNCARCHKNSGAQATVSCKGCHVADPFTPEALKQQRDQQPPIYHRDKPGLKAAYHVSCLGCHQKMGGPTGCQDCHKRNDGGDALFKSGKYAPKAPAKPQAAHH
jgi:hypothetical protein